MQQVLWIVAAFLFGVAAGLIREKVWVPIGCALKKLCDRLRCLRDRKFGRRKGREMGLPLALDRIDKRVESLTPQVWMQRRMADDEPEGKGVSVMSGRVGWRRVS